MCLILGLDGNIRVWAQIGLEVHDIRPIFSFVTGKSTMKCCLLHGLDAGTSSPLCRMRWLHQNRGCVLLHTWQLLEIPEITDSSYHGLRIEIQSENRIKQQHELRDHPNGLTQSQHQGKY